MAEFVQNGDFSSGIDGWTDASTGSGTFTESGGVGTLTVTDNVDVALGKQTVTGLVIGNEYDFSLKSSNNGGSPQDVFVVNLGTTDGGDEIFTATVSSSTDLTNHAHTWTATTTTVYLEMQFTGPEAGGSAIVDDASIDGEAEATASSTKGGKRELLFEYAEEWVRRWRRLRRLREERARVPISPLPRPEEPEAPPVVVPAPPPPPLPPRPVFRDLTPQQEALDNRLAQLEQQYQRLLSEADGRHANKLNRQLDRIEASVQRVLKERETDDVMLLMLLVE